MSGPTPSIQYAWDGPGTLGAGQDGLFVRWNDSAKKFEMAAAGGGGDHGSLTGLSDDDHTQYVSLAPGSSTRNVVQPTGASFIPFIIKGASSQSANMFEQRRSDDTALWQITSGSKLYRPYPASGETAGVDLAMEVSGGGHQFLVDNLGRVVGTSCNFDRVAVNAGYNSYLENNLLKLYSGGSLVAPSPTNDAWTLDRGLALTSSLAGMIPLVAKMAASPTVSAFEVRDSSDNILSRFNKGGYFMTRKVAAPADGDLATSELALWFDDTAGAAKLMIKAKNASGTVVTGSVSLT